MLSGSLIRLTETAGQVIKKEIDRKSFNFCVLKKLFGILKIDIKYLLLTLY